MKLKLAIVIFALIFSFTAGAAALITTSDLADGAVTSAKIADYTVNSIDIASGAIKTRHLSDKVVTTRKIALGAVKTGRIADSAVTSAKIADSAVTSADIANGTITSSDLALNAVGTAALSDNAVTSPKIANGSITNEDISPLANIAASKIADGSGSGLVADLLDGYDSSYFVPFASANTLFLKKTVDDTVSANLNVVGTVTAANFNYKNPKTSYLAFAPIAFRPVSNSLNYTLDLTSISVNDEGTYSFYAPVYLPSGVRITALKYTAYVYTKGIGDPLSTSSSTLTLKSLNTSGVGSVTDLATVTVAGGTDFVGYYSWKTNQATTDVTVDSQNYAYFVEVTATKPVFLSSNTEAKAGPVVITYTYQAP